MSISKRYADYKNRIQDAKDVRQRLNDIASKHQWRQDPNAIRLQMLNDPVIRNTLLKLSGKNLNQFNKLLNSSQVYVLQQIQKKQSQNLDPTHPQVLNNPNHPMNPSSPIATQLNLANNAALNPLFLQYLNSQAEVLESIGIEKSENREYENEEQQEDVTAGNLLQSVLADEALTNGMQTELQTTPELNPYNKLELRENATQEEAEIAALNKMAQNAPEPGQKPSHEFMKTAAAASLVLSGAKFDKELEKGFSQFMNPASTPTPSPMKGS